MTSLYAPQCTNRPIFTLHFTERRAMRQRALFVSRKTTTSVVDWGASSQPKRKKKHYICSTSRLCLYNMCHWCLPKLGQAKTGTRAGKVLMVSWKVIGQLTKELSTQNVFTDSRSNNVKWGTVVKASHRCNRTTIDSALWKGNSAPKPIKSS